eukprot:Protomagalhaensia_sp_Gyna_25__2419@NODE_2347_length_1136_cov_66_045579_g1945_i0_p1_GENE_NODE_2347_length_1136_cov_66_045579_g1945_i0NODE_2347_length_1136_cov_66_045579_g1945_i0_p1_ORF_typecomplete_len337_score46_56DUF3546/PF12066_8/1_1e08_NODE_2347_length_1136_cov_66_045579_g1945_i0771087
MQSPDTRRRLSGGSLGRHPPPPPPNGTNPVAPVFERFHSFKDFMLLQKDTLEPERAVQLYDHYRYDFKVHTARALFAQFQNLGFVKQRFDPTLLRQLMLEKIQLAQKSAPLFVQAVKTGSLNPIDLSVHLADPKMLPSLLTKDPAPVNRVIGTYTGSDAANLEVTEAPFFGTNPNKDARTLLLRKLPGTLTRAEILETVQDVEGLVSLTVMPSCLSLENQRGLLAQARKDTKDCSEAELQALDHAVAECYIKSKPLMIPLLTAWLEYDSVEHCAAAELALEKRPINDVCTLSPLRVKPTNAAPIRVCSIATCCRTATDLELVNSLIMYLVSSCPRL